jgi:hypothetical protein
LVRRCIGVIARYRIHEKLIDGHRRFLFFRHQRDIGGQIAASTFTRDGNALGVAVQCMDAFDEPFVCSPGVVVLCGELAFGRMVVVDGHHKRLRAQSQGTWRCIVSIQISDHPAPTMEIKDDGKRPVAFWDVGARRKRPSGRWDREVLRSDLGLRIRRDFPVSLDSSRGVGRTGLQACLRDAERMKCLGLQ